MTVVFLLFYNLKCSISIIFNISLIIHEENTKKTHERVVSLHVIEISVNLHKFEL